ncbi:hypothetical protein SUDANB105_03292 [Streptomyces sp. enrichment culture]
MRAGVNRRIDTERARVLPKVEEPFSCAPSLAM